MAVAFSSSSRAVSATYRRVGTVPAARMMPARPSVMPAPGLLG
ncbi:hypothetical protein QF050_000476 [Arthrobacter sp. SLBN-112]|nr:hypothetical protein [Arthrobacter sp. SLBN-112]